MMKLHTKNKGSKDREFRFYKDNNQRWFVDLPEWKASKYHLEMVQGADRFLESMRTPHKNDVVLKTSLEYFDGARKLDKAFDDKDGDGAWYDYINKHGRYETFWLCGVMTWFYGYNPDKIYFRKVKRL